jgi:cell fate regulator YaaT (PSP1 superfamily)
MPGNYIVRYGATRNVAEFSYKGNTELARAMSVLVRSDRGVEWGEVLCEATDRTRDHMGDQPVGGKVLRQADDEARKKLDEVRLGERDVFFRAKEMIKEHKLNMQLVDAEKLFGGERLIFYYLAEQRVDFRELVKAFAKQFQTRIEMRQIGVRDEARLLADYGDCGKPVCCGTHLKEMPPVSMKMAKLQKATLDPNKISGRCGRLKCCLRYEYETYEEYRRELPSPGATILTKKGQGRVIYQEILAQKVLAEMEGGRRMVIDKADIITVVKSNKDGDRAHDSGPGSKRMDHDRKDKNQHTKERPKEERETAQLESNDASDPANETESTE